jgi:hypothetical protein
MSKFVAFSHMSDAINDDGELLEEVKANPYGPQGQLDGLLEDLQWYSDALAAARVQTSAVAA